MLPQIFSVLVTVVGKGVERSSVPFVLKIVTLRATFLKVHHVWEKTMLVIFGLKRTTSISTKHSSSFLLWKEIKKYCDFVVCAFDGCGATKFFHQRILPEEQHWNFVLPKLTKFWRTCILPEVLGKWYTRKHFMAQVQTDKQPEAGGICYCRKNTDEKGVLRCNPRCPIVSFIYHVSRLKAFQKLGTAPIAET